MAGNPPFITITDTLKEILWDWQYMINKMATEPTSVLQLVTNYPDYVGYSDACTLGAGGAWTLGLKQVQNFLWQVEWPSDIHNQLITDSNPQGTIPFASAIPSSLMYLTLNERGDIE